MKVFLYTIFALVAFAFNSILCRLALRGEEADAAGFTAVRLVSGAIALLVISYFVAKGRNLRRGEGVSDAPNAQAKNTLPDGPVSAFGRWPSAIFLFVYAICFSFAYLDLNAGTGALILFGSVQVTMILTALIRGERPGTLEWLGLIVALGGLIYLVYPGLASPPPLSSALMAGAGVAWGAYTIRGKTSADPLGDTTGNFVWAVPLAIVAAVYFWPQVQLTTRGIILAVLSGAIASGVGYTVWYAALKHHASTRAAVLQLAVPVITAAGGILFLSEAATTRLWIAGALILGGIGLTILGRGKG